MSIRRIIEGVLGDSAYEVIVTGYRVGDKGIMWKEVHEEVDKVMVNADTMGEAVEKALAEFIETNKDIPEEAIEIKCKKHTY